MANDDILKPWPQGKAPAAQLCAEDKRATVLASYGLDALEDDPELSQITAFAASLCNAPIALVSLVEDERQRFLARAGLEERETSRPTSFCAHAMLEPDPMVVCDAAHDERFSTNPLVTGHPHIRFYAGAPLISHEGAPLGSLCVIDTEPRKEGLTDLQVEGLLTLAQGVMRRLRHRREHLERQSELESSERRLRNLADSIPDVVFSANAEGHFEYFNDRWYELTGLPRGEFEDSQLAQALHPEDEKAWRDAWQESLRTGNEYEVEYRLRRKQGDYRWVLARAIPFRRGDGAVTHWFGTLTDIDANHRRSEQRALLASELAHRIKNIFAVISSLATLRARGNPEREAFAAELSDTVRALGRANEYVRPLSEEKEEDLHTLLEVLTAPYGAGDARRVFVTGNTVPIGSAAATPLALIFHELATNAAKYGALSTDEGRVAIAIETQGDDAAIEWREHGGPATPPPTDKGFGTRLLDMSVNSQLSGKLEREWLADGLCVTMAIPRKSLAL